MLHWIKSFFYKETNTITPNSMAPIPKGKFFNYLIEKAPVDEDESEEIFIQGGKPLDMNIFFSKYGRFNYPDL